MPTFSILIPVYNRTDLLLRALRSCLQQNHDGFEVIVVDDASSDDVAGAVAVLGDKRVKVVRQPSNSGPGPARNRGADHAVMEWVVCLDSDDELLPGALNMMAKAIETTPSVAGFRFMCRLDDGTLSPEPPLHDGVWSYEDYLTWAASVLQTRQETLPCVRTETFKQVRYPNRRGNIEALYHLDFARAFKIGTSGAVVRSYHGDAPDQLTRPHYERTLTLARGYSEYFSELLERHGEAMRRVAPDLLAHFTRALATQRFLNSDRLGGMRTLARLMRVTGPTAASAVVLALGLAGPRPLAWARTSTIRTYLGVPAHKPF